MCDVIQQPAVVKFVGGVPSENPAEAVSNPMTGRVRQPALCTVSTQTESADDESIWLLPGYDQDFHDLEQDGDRLRLDFAPYKEETNRTTFDAHVLNTITCVFC